MKDVTKEISRKELYKKVWAISMVKLAKEFGLSDVGLAKICKKYNIPRPPRGYWARKAAGYDMKQFPLPPGENETIIITPNPYSKNRDHVSSMPDSIQLEEPIIVPDRLSSPHPLIKQTSEILNGRQPNDVGIIVVPKKGCLDINVSKSSLRRALRVMDTIIKSLEKMGNSVSLLGGRTKTKIHEVPMSFGISEKLTTKKRKPEDHDLSGRYRFGHSRFIEERVPSGELCLTIHEAGDFYLYGCQQNWKDGKKSKVEYRINSFIDGLITVAVAKIERDKERAEEERRRIEREKQLEEKRLKRAEIRRMYLEEEARVNELVTEAENWKKSKILREYIVEVEKQINGNKLSFSLDRPVEEWLKWARDQADRLDPLSPSPSSILDKECPEEKPKNDYSWHRDW